MKKNNEHHCRNCKEAMPVDVKFCPNCSQKNSDGRITFKELLHQFLSDLLNLDGRIFQTLKALSIPGKLTDDFFQGMQKRYYHPVRLFIFSGAIFIAMLSVTANKSGIKNSVDNSWKKIEQTHQLKKSYDYLTQLTDSVETEFQDSILTPAFDTLNRRFKTYFSLEQIDSVNIDAQVGFRLESDPKDKNIPVAIDDVINLPEDSIISIYNIKGFWEQQLFLQNLRIRKSTSSFIFYLIKNILWMVLIMMPMLAVVLKLVYYKKSYYYIEHLIFSFHTHTFIFLLSGMMLGAGIWIGYDFFDFAILIFGIYLIFAMKRFYKQNWWWTALKFLIVTIFYFGVMFLSLFITTVASLFFF